MNRLLAVCHVLSTVILLFAFTPILPLVLAWLLDNDLELKIYAWTIFITGISGFFLWLMSRHHKREMRARDAFLLVVLVWTILPIFAAIPFRLHLPTLSWTHAYFEAISGLTTTGATILSKLDQLPASLLIWRSFLVWIGGMGILVLAIAIMPLLGVGGSQLYRAATPGPMKESKLTPRITETAKGLFFIYLSLSILCLFALKIAGMSWFDSWIHAFSIMGLGAFSSHDSSFAYFNSPAIEFVAILFMLIASINFATHFVAWRKLSFNPYSKDIEARMMLSVLLVSAIGIAFYLSFQGVYSEFWSALRYAVFNTVSIASTTGFSNSDYSKWPIFAPLWLLFLSVFVTSSGSAGGGIKMVRAELIARQTLRELTRIMHPKSFSQVRLFHQPVENKVVFAVLALIPVYVGSIVLVIMFLTATGLDIVSALSAAIACINNVGPGLNQVGPATTYASLSSFQNWICIAAMLLGRLELFTVLVILAPTFWRR